MIKRILKADKIYTAVSPPLENGMIAIDHENSIAQIGKEIDSNGIEVEQFKGALCPGFINTHCHLELSHLKGKIKRHTGLDGFIKDLQFIRDDDHAELQNAIANADQQMQEAGIVAVGDICNASHSFKTKKMSSIKYHNFLELFAFEPSMAEHVFQKGMTLKNEADLLGLKSSIVPHSPYSVSLLLFEKISRMESNSRLSIHNQETASENELYRSGTGKLAKLLQTYGLDLKMFNPSGRDSLTTYLKFLPSDVPLLLVHNTYSSKENIEHASKIHANLYWCFCPKANLYIENKLPDIPSFIQANVKCTLGTDSLASNDGLSIFEEMKAIQTHFSDIKTETLIPWACINGAKFLGVDNQLGSLEVGKKAKINHLIEEKGKLETMKVIT